MNTFRRVVIGFVLAPSVMCSAIFGAETIFLGEDLNLNNPPFSSPDNPPRIAHPNADAARDAYLAAVFDNSVEDFEAFSHGTVQSVFTVGGSSVVMSPTPTVAELGEGTMVGRYPISGRRYLEWITLTSPFVITLQSPHQAWGLYITDLGDVGGKLNVNMTLNDGSLVHLNANSQAGVDNSGSVIFVGYLNSANPVNEISIDVIGGLLGDGIGIDDLHLGSARTPDAASSIRMLAVAFAVLAVARAARRNV